jgi:hypothetical protein
MRDGRSDRLNRNTYMTTATLFLVMAVIHLLKIIFGWHVEIGGLSVPFLVSWLAVLAAGALAYFGFVQAVVCPRKYFAKESRRSAGRRDKV